MDFSSIKSIHIPEGEVVKIYTPSAVYWQKKPSYTELEYLELNSDYHFDTGYYGNLNTKIECKWQRSVVDGAVYIYGCASSDNEASITAYCTTGTGNWRFGSAAEGQATATTDVHVTIQSKEAIFRDNVNTPYNPAPSGNFTTPHTLIVAGNNTASGTVSRSYRFKGKFYYFKIWDNGKLIIDWIPVNYEGVNGFWDKVTNKFVAPIP